MALYGFSSPQRRNLIMSLLLLNTLSTISFAFNQYDYWYRVRDHQAKLYVFIVLCAATNASLLLTVSREPGVIPRQEDRDIVMRNIDDYKSDPINYRDQVFKPVRMS